MRRAQGGERDWTLERALSARCGRGPMSSRRRRCLNLAASIAPRLSTAIDIFQISSPHASTSNQINRTSPHHGRAGSAAAWTWGRAFRLKGQARKARRRRGPRSWRSHSMAALCSAPTGACPPAPTSATVRPIRSSSSRTTLSCCGRGARQTRRRSGTMVRLRGAALKRSALRLQTRPPHAPVPGVNNRGLPFAQQFGTMPRLHPH
jgi:hypothetical protein